ncbi:MAG: Bax inhibitor-1/YccA family protein [Synergistaceae bacterium]|nr:Bax inhibitor-1/YccA family protein [Synergistaceae bacterium]
MAQYENYMPSYAGTDTLEITNTLFRKVYQFMALGLIITALTAYFTAATPAMIRFFYGSRAPLIIAAVVEIGLVLYLGFAINKISAGTALTLFLLYSFVNGLTLSILLLVYTQASVYQAFFTAAGMFGVMSVYGLFTKKDLTGMGSFLIMGLFGIIIASLINIFVRSSGMEMIISIMGIIIFMGLTAYDTAKIKQLSMTVNGADSSALTKIAVIGALQLYLDFINLFIYLLRIFGKQRD